MLTAQHVIADGLSIVYLVRDLLRLLESPGAPITVLDAAASPEEPLPPEVRRRVARSAWRFQLLVWLTQAYARLRLRRAQPARRRTRHHRS